jgi:integral membrane sensor domain MASE1
VQSTKIEVKVVAATAATLLASVAFAVLDALAHHTEIFDSLPEWLRFVVLAAIPPVLTFLAGYAVPSNRV